MSDTNLLMETIVDAFSQIVYEINELANDEDVGFEYIECLINITHHHYKKIWQIYHYKITPQILRQKTDPAFNMLDFDDEIRIIDTSKDKKSKRIGATAGCVNNQEGAI